MLAKNVKSKRLKLGLTQQGLAEQVNLTKSTICDVEHGRTNLSIKAVSRIAKVFNCTIDELVN